MFPKIPPDIYPLFPIAKPKSMCYNEMYRIRQNAPKEVIL